MADSAGGSVPTDVTGEKIRCGKCGKEAKNPGSRLPHGWKRKGDEPRCDECWNKEHVLRAIVIPVVSPGENVTWKELNDALQEMFRTTTRASNWIITELAKRETRPVGQDAKLGPMPPVDDPKPAPSLYMRAREVFPSLPPQSMSSLIQSIVRKYRAKRREVVWRCSESLPNYRYPQPLPVHNQSWTPSLVEDRPIVSVRVTQDKRFELRLKGGARYRRQLAAFRGMCTGEAQYGELALYQAGSDLMCKMVAWIPRRAEKKLEGVLYVRTAPESLLVAFNAKDEKLWIWNADHVKRWAAEHAQHLQRWSEDQKAEQRPVPEFAERRAAAAKKYHHRMHTAADQAAAYLANYAARRRFAVVEYNDSDKSYFEKFVWYRLKERLAIALDERGITFSEPSAAKKTA